MFAKNESNERELLLHDFDEENPFIDTLAILNRIEKQDELSKLYELLRTYKTSTIDFWKQYKYGMYGTVVTTGILSAGGYTVSFLKFGILPYFQKELSQIIRYNNTFINDLNATCGTLIPLEGTIDSNIFHSASASFCADTMFYENMMRSFSRLYIRDCMNDFKLDNYCDWPTLGNTAFNCAVRLNQYYQLQCGSSFVAGRYINKEELHQNCFGITPIPPLSYLCQNLPTSPPQIQCATIALDVCNLLIKSYFNLTVPGHMYSCTDKYISPDVFSQCKSAADDRSEVNTNYFLFFLLLIPLLLFLLMVFFFGIRTGLDWINKKDQINSLPLDEQNLLFDVLNKFGLAANITEETPVTEVIDFCVATKEQIINEKKIINDRRFSFLIGREEPGSVIPNNLPNEIAYKILHFSNLFSKAPIEMTAEEYEKKTSQIGHL